MGSAPLTRMVLGPGLFILLAAGLLLTRLLPLSGTGGGWPGPDLLLCLSIAWVMRRPDLLPVWAVAAVALLGDLLLQRPPGLWAALLVLGTEFARWRSQPGQSLPIAGEMSLFAGLCAALICINWLVLTAFMVPQVSLGNALAQVPPTVLAYPVVLLVLVQVLGVRRPTETGHRIARSRA